MSARRLGALVVGGAVITGCWLFASLDATTDGDAGDVVVNDAFADAGSLGDPAKWTSYAPTIDVMGHSYATFDGRYVYFLPGQGTKVLRYDTQLEFHQQSAWTAHDIGINNTSGVVANTTLYVVRDTSGPAYKLDTTGDFELGWIAIASVSSPLIKFSGAAFDGQRVYAFGAVDGGEMYLANLAGTSWSTLPFPTLVNHAGTTFDGRYMYGAGMPDASTYSTAVRFDVDASTSTLFDMTGLGGMTKQLFQNMSGTTFDGRYVYFTPTVGSGSNDTIARVDTTLPFDVATSWSVYKIAAATTYSSGAPIFDGRYVYMPEASRSRLLRYDTGADFHADGSYELVDVASVFDAATIQFAGAAFDGEYVYLPLSTAPQILRFDARQPKGAMPSAYHGSFH